MRSLLTLALLLPSILYAADAPAPVCAHPAQLESHLRQDNPYYYVGFKPDADVVALRARLLHYGLSDTKDAPGKGGWGIVLSSLTGDEIAELRCDPDIQLISVPSGT
jgi:hypothetical protein